MKKKIALTIGAIALTTILGLGIYHSDAANAEPALSKADIRVMVESQYPGTITEIELEKDRNKVVYEVEVKSDNKMYEIRLDGDTGEVIKLEEKVYTAKGEGKGKGEVEVEVEGDVGSKGNVNTEGSGSITVKEKDEDTDVQSNDNADSENKPDEKVTESGDDSTKQDDKTVEKRDNKKESSKETTIDVEAAKRIALEEFPGTVTEIELDEEDGLLIYEIVVETISGEAEFEIDAYTGEIVVISIDTDLDISIGDEDEENEDE